MEFSSVNDFSYLKRRFRNKDVAELLEISESSLYRYSKGLRKPPKHIIEKAKDIRNLAPKKPTKKSSVKRKRIKKIRKKISKKYEKVDKKINQDCCEEVDKKITKDSIVTIYEYLGDLKDIKYCIIEISKNDTSDNVVYQIIKIKYEGNNKIFDSTYNYHIDSIDKLIENFKRILSKYTSGLIDENQKEKIMIKRTEYL